MSFCQWQSVWSSDSERRPRHYTGTREQRLHLSRWRNRYIYLPADQCGSSRTIIYTTYSSNTSGWVNAPCKSKCCMCVSGVALAVILSGVRHISDTVFLEAAKVWKHHKAFLNLFFKLPPLLTLSLLPAFSCWLCLVFLWTLFNPLMSPVPSLSRDSACNS